VVRGDALTTAADPDDVTVLWDGRRLEAVMEWLDEIEA
jgi:hypothetical protein